MTVPDREACEALDAEDPLAPFREHFRLPDGVIYLDGNSLGALPKTTAARVAAVIEEEWGRDLIQSWNTHQWIEMPARVGDKIGRLIGASPGQVVAADSTSVNLFKLLAVALKLRPDRKVILSEKGNFPTDLYIAEGVRDWLGRGIELRLVEADDIPGAIDDRVAVVMLTHVDYRSGARHDMARVTESAHAAGALMLWDLAHSAGAMPLALDACGADLAVGCGYKYLNGGPGAPAFLYVAERWQEAARQPLSGWMGHAAPFAFEPAYRPAAGVSRQLCGTPAILGLAALDCGVDLLLEANMSALREKSERFCDLFIACMETRCEGHDFRLASPREAAARGSQVSFRHDDGYPIVQCLIAEGVIGDFRSPDIVRFGFAPLYTRYVDVWDAVDRLTRIMQTRRWDRDEFRRRARVT